MQKNQPSTPLCNDVWTTSRFDSQWSVQERALGVEAYAEAGGQMLPIYPSTMLVLFQESGREAVCRLMSTARLYPVQLRRDCPTDEGSTATSRKVTNSPRRGFFYSAHHVPFILQARLVTRRWVCLSGLVLTQCLQAQKHDWKYRKWHVPLKRLSRTLWIEAMSRLFSGCPWRFWGPIDPSGVFESTGNNGQGEWRTNSHVHLITARRS